MSSGMQPVYRVLNPLDYGGQITEGVHVLVWYDSLKLPAQEEIKIKNSSRNELRKSNR